MGANLLETKSIAKREGTFAGGFSVRPGVKQKDARNFIGRLWAIGHTVAAWDDGFTLNGKEMGRPVRDDAIRAPRGVVFSAIADDRVKMKMRPESRVLEG